MAQGLYNHSTVPLTREEEEMQEMQERANAEKAANMSSNEHGDDDDDDDWRQTLDVHSGQEKTQSISSFEIMITSCSTSMQCSWLTS